MVDKKYLGWGPGENGYNLQLPISKFYINWQKHSYCTFDSCRNGRAQSYREALLWKLMDSEYKDILI